MHQQAAAHWRVCLRVLMPAPLGGSLFCYVRYVAATPAQPWTRHLTSQHPSNPPPPQVVRFLSLAEAIGSKLLTANTTKLAATLAEFRRVAERDVYGPLLSSSKFKHGEEAA